MLKKLISISKFKKLSKQEILTINGGSISPNTRYCLREFSICLSSGNHPQACIAERDLCFRS